MTQPEAMAVDAVVGLAIKTTKTSSRGLITSLVKGTLTDSRQAQAF